MKKQICVFILSSLILCSLVLIGCSAISVNDDELTPTTFQSGSDDMENDKSSYSILLR